MSDGPKSYSSNTLTGKDRGPRMFAIAKLLWETSIDKDDLWLQLQRYNHGLCCPPLEEVVLRKNIFEPIIQRRDATFISPSPVAWVYFIQDTGTGLVKIGHSSSPLDRLRQLGTGNGNRLMLIGALPGTVELEKRLHSQFSDYRQLNEWFALTPDLIDLISASHFGATA